MNEFKEFTHILESILDSEDILLDEPMKNHTSFRVGGKCDILLTPKKCDQIIKIIDNCKEKEIPYYIIGNGSNIIVKDGGIRGVVIKTSKLNNIKIQGDLVIAEGGALLSSVSKKAADSSLTGLEFGSGIPGSIGGAVAMNAGAYNGEISQIIESAIVLDNDGKEKELSKEELELGYRNSAILKYGYTVLKVKLKLHTGDKEKIFNRISELASRRKEKQPLEYPSAGSTFKRPEGNFAGKLIEESNLKGVSVGGAQVSCKHAGFVINKGGATAKDILDLIELIQQRVKENSGIELKTEVRIIGED